MTAANQPNPKREPSHEMAKDRALDLSDTAAVWKSQLFASFFFGGI
jgi:hypothetical protein